MTYYINWQSPASYAFAQSMLDQIDSLPDAAQVDMMKFIYGTGQ